jgi:hypothetical protein
MKSLTLMLLLAAQLGLHAQTSGSIPTLRGTSLTISTSTNHAVLPSTNRDPRIGVSVSLRNRSSSPLTFEFESLQAATARFQFNVYSAADDQLIHSTLANPQSRSRAATTITQHLGARSSWAHNSIIPLKIDDTWLAPGTYRVEAVLLADPAVFAATIFHISEDQNRPPPSPETGITGIVYAPLQPGEESAPPAPGTQIRITSLQPGNSFGLTTSSTQLHSPQFHGITDADGHFTIRLRPGRYDAHFLLNNSLTPGRATLTLEVGETGFVPLEVQLSSPPRIIDRPLPQPIHHLVSQVDSLSAQLVTKDNGQQVIRVSATATVPHPGHNNPRLIIPQIAPAIAATDGSILFLNFVVDPPDPRLFYPMVLAQVSATAEFPYTNESTVWITSASDTATTSISKPQ